MTVLRAMISRFLLGSILLYLGVAACEKKAKDSPSLLPPNAPAETQLPQPPAPITDPVTDIPENPAPLPDNQICPQKLEVESSAETCVQTAPGESDLTYLEGTVLSFERPIIGGGLLYNSKGIILCTGCACRDQAIEKKATRISCPNGVISPALINSHDHLGWAAAKPGNWGAERFEHRNDWRGGKRNHSKVSVPKSGGEVEVALGELRQLMTGTVSIAGSSAIAGFLRNLDDERALEGLISEPVIYNTFPLENSSDYDFRFQNCEYSRQKALGDLNYGHNLMHVSEGIDDAARNEFLCLSRSDAGGLDVTKSHNSYIHAIGLLTPDAQQLASQGTAVVWSPRSNIALYGNTAPVTLYRNLGINIALGTDWTPSGSAVLNRELQCAASLNAKYYDSAFSDRDLWLMATAQAASAMKMEQRLGRLEPGMVADIAIFKAQPGRNPYAAIFQAEAAQTSLVIRGGKALYGESALIESLQENCQTLDVCGVAKRLCYEGESGALKAKDIKDFAAFQDAIKNDYPLYFCGKPTDEPSCEPQRKGSYESSNALDHDGDGVIDSVDNCPKVFNPIRPVDHGLQADFDHDGIGDSCDLCPAGDDNNQCQKALEGDRDHDAVADYKDNCPLISNADQLDFDKDGRGDVCDPCASLSNPDLRACPVTGIRALKIPQLGLDAIQLKAKVQLQGLVTAITPTGFYLQDQVDPSAEIRTQSFGIFVYHPKGAKPVLGQRLSLEATYDQFKSQYQLQDMTSFQVLEEKLVPAVFPLSQETWKNSVPLEHYEGLLVKTQTSGSVSYPESSADAAAFLIDNTIAVGQSLALYTRPMRGSEVSVTGILRKYEGRFMIEPRQQDDIQILSQGLPYLIGFNAPQAFAEVGYEGLTQPGLSLSVDRPAPEDLVIPLSSSLPEFMRFPESITIRAGESSVTLPAFHALKKTEAIVLTARLHQRSVAVRILVLEQPKPQLLPLAKADLRSGVGAKININLHTDLPASFLGQGETIELKYDAQALELLNRPILAPGTQELFLEFRGLAAGTSRVEASLNGSSIAWNMILIAQDLALSEVFVDPMGDDAGQEWVEIANISGRDLDLSQYAIGGGGENYTTLRYPLKGLLPAGACAVVGGPKSGTNNFSPKFFQAEIFPGGLQNGGTAADAIGIFAQKAEDIKVESLPLDTFVYGGEENKAKFRAPDGAVAPVHVSKLLSGQSAEKIDGQWVAQSQPTPGLCRGFAADH